MEISKYGEVIVTKDSKKFLSVLNQMTNENFKKFHRSDAIFFVGVKDWSIDDFYFAGQMFSENYVLRNILVAIDKETWYPIFMFVINHHDNTFDFIEICFKRT